jgi:GH25 family lysozyme M1 (1,4-beta-N-acetylmuramidase)
VQLILSVVAVVLMAPAPAAEAAPAGYPITGIDVSAYQGTVDWGAVAAGGARFAYIRASEQQGIPDAYFPANYQGAKANGLYAGAYHRARPDLSGGTAQADYLIDHAGYVEDGRTLPPMLDIEWPRSNWTGLNACYNMTPAQVSGWIRDFVAEVSARTGRLAMIYTNPNWWNPCTGRDTSFGAYPLFNSGYLPSPPPPPAGWAAWTLWQYSNSGALPGDQDVFNGDQAALARLSGGTPFGLRAHADGRWRGEIRTAARRSATIP